MKLLWLLLLSATLLQFVPYSNQEAHGLRLPESAISEDEEGDKAAAFDAQKDDSPPGTEEEEPARRVRGRTVKRRRRLRKRMRTTTEPPMEELNEQLNPVEQQNPPEQQAIAELQTPEQQRAAVEQSGRVQQTSQEVPYEQPRDLEEAVTALPQEETTRRRPGKRRRRPHRKQSNQQNGTSEGPEEGSAETPKPPRRRRKGGRRRPRPTVQPTEPNKIEMYIETTMMPPEVPEITTPVYVVETATQPPPPVPLPPRLHLSESPDHTLTVMKDDNTPLYQIYDSRHNLVSQPSVNQVVDGNSQHFSEVSRIPDTSLLPEPSRFPQQPTMQQEFGFPEPTKYTETRFPHAQNMHDFPEEYGSKFPNPDTPKSTVTLEYPKPTKFTEHHFPQPSEQPEDINPVVRHQSDTSFHKPSKPPPVYEEPVEYPPISKFPDTQKYLEQEPSQLPEVVQIDTAHRHSSNSDESQKPYSARSAANIIKPVQELIQETDPEPSEHLQEQANKDSNEVPSQPPTEFVSSQPAFDRKSLFAKSRKLPETSAVIRKKLIPRYQRVQQENGKGTSNAEAPEKLVPEGFTDPPQTVEPSKLIEKLKAHAKAYRTTTVMIPPTMMTTEEPNYPKFESQKKNSVAENIVKTTTESVRSNKVVEVHRSRGKVVITTTQVPQLENLQTTELQETSETDTTEPGKVIVDKVPENQTTAFPEKTDKKELDLNKLNDSIVELIQSESGNMKLSEILESRNMTLAQLLAHRERGSKHFHLVDIFSKRKSIIGENTTDSMNADKAEVGTPISLDKQTIPFPSQDVLGSFPSFISKVENGVQTKDGANETTTRRSVHLDNRVPRVFDSMPEFKKTTEQPPWRVPNPKLRPVNVRGDIEEIKISQYPPENPKSENDIDHAFLLDDKGDLLRANRGVATLDAESPSNETAFGRFKRIPVTVKSAIIISVAILMLAIFGFLSVLISCRLKQKKARLRVKQDFLCEHLKTEDFMNSQQSLSPVLTKHQGRAPPVFTQNATPTDSATNRQYYLWRTLRKTFQYD